MSRGSFSSISTLLMGRVGALFNYFTAFFEIYSRAYRAKKKVHALFFSRKKRTFGEEIEECVLAWGEALENPPGPWKGG